MAAISTYLANKILDHTLRNVAYTPAATVYVALYTSNPNPDNSGTQVTGGSYARQSISFAAASAQQVLSAALVTFPTATASWGTVTYFGILDDVSGGNLLYFGPLNNPKTVDVDDVVKINAGDLAVSAA